MDKRTRLLVNTLIVAVNTKNNALIKQVIDSEDLFGLRAVFRNRDILDLAVLEDIDELHDYHDPNLNSKSAVLYLMEYIDAVINNIPQEVSPSIYLPIMTKFMEIKLALQDAKLLDVKELSKYPKDTGLPMDPKLKTLLEDEDWEPRPVKYFDKKTGKYEWIGKADDKQSNDSQSGGTVPTSPLIAVSPKAQTHYYNNNKHAKAQEGSLHIEQPKRKQERPHHTARSLRGDQRGRN